MTDAWVEVTTDAGLWQLLAMDAARFDIDTDEPFSMPSKKELLDEALEARCESL